MTDKEIKEHSEENYTKVYLKGDMSLNTEEKYFAYTKGYCKGYTDGLVEGGKEKQTIIDIQTVQIESRDVYLVEKENIIIRQQTEIQELKMKLLALENKG